MASPAALAQDGTFLTVPERPWIHYNHLKSIGYFRVYPWCCTISGMWPFSKHKIPVSTSCERKAHLAKTRAWESGGLSSPRAQGNLLTPAPLAGTLAGEENWTGSQAALRGDLLSSSVALSHFHLIFMIHCPNLQNRNILNFKGL